MSGTAKGAKNVKQELPKNPHKAVPKGPKAVHGVWRALDILGRTWAVFFAEGTLYCDSELVHGYTDSWQQEIAISGMEARELQRQTLLHEIRHAIIHITNGSHPSDDEQCTRLCETGWYHFLREPKNDWAIDFIREENV